MEKIIIIKNFTLYPIWFMKIKIINSSGFSILMAMGVTGILLIIVTSLALTYIRESRLSRFSYDEVLSSTAGEWFFEYGMLKIRNHKDGFQDTVSSVDPDGKILQLSTPRSEWLQTHYSIIASSTGQSFSLSGGHHLVIPLFISNETLIIPGGIESKNPSYNTGTTNTSNLSISGIWNQSWTIVAMSGSESIAITGSGDINPTKIGSIRIQATQCYDSNGNLWVNPARDSFGNCVWIYSPSQGGEVLAYSYDEYMSIGTFLWIRIDPYFILQNSNNFDITLNFSSTAPFSLPTTTLTATATKWDSSQVFRFTEDKWKYYDALKYWIYNNP